jgi:cytochrome c oxidase subunit 2
MGKIYFELGKAVILPDGSKVVEVIVGQLKADPSAKVNISGYADKTGNADQNLELAKQRAMAVRDALKSGGIAEERLVLLKPEFVIAGTAEAEARRVEVNKAP